MEVADELVVINHGRIEQVGPPAEVYDRPANGFVMEFLGPVTRLGGHVVRPHDIEVFAEPVTGALAAEITRVQRIGFEVRTDVRTDDGGEAWVQLTRGQADALEIDSGSRVWLRPAVHASAVTTTGGSAGSAPQAAEAMGRG